MPRLSRLFFFAAFMAALLTGIGCKGTANERDRFFPLFGDGSHDTTPVWAKVGDIEITDMDLDLYLDELPPAQRAKYNGPDGRRLALAPDDVLRRADTAMLQAKERGKHCIATASGAQSQPVGNAGAGL